MTGTRLRLHGHPVSNYVNIVRAALIEKQLDHDFVETGASQDEAFLAANPMGKIPVLETPHGWLGETVAILDYLCPVIILGITPRREAPTRLHTQSRRVQTDFYASSLHHNRPSVAGNLLLSN